MSKTLDLSLSTQQLELVSTTEQESPSLLRRKLDALGQKCIECGEVKSLTQDYYPNNTTRCKKCLTKRSTDDVYKRRSKRDALVRPKPDNCELCGKLIPNNKPCYDHDHETGQFRGWLCYGCNTGLGRFGDNIAGLEQAIEYLKRYHETLN